MNQAGHDWHAWRRAGIGSSDAPVIMGVSKWRTIFKLWEEKTGLVVNDDAPNWAMRRGIENEPRARAHYELMSDCEMQPACIMNPTYPFLRASMDGYNSEKRWGLEIKCAGKADHEIAKSGRIPPHYLPQVHHQLLVTQADGLDYLSYNIASGEALLVKVEPDLCYQATLLEKELEFWDLVQNKIPPEMSAREMTKLGDQDLQSLFLHFRELHATKARTDSEYIAVTEALLEKLKNRKKPA